MWNIKTDGRHLLIDFAEYEPGHDTCCWRLTPTANWGGRRSSPSSPNLTMSLVLRSYGTPGRQSPVLIDPRISFGAPMIKGVPTWVLKGRYEAGESRDDFSLTEKEIQHGLEFEGIHHAVTFFFDRSVGIAVPKALQLLRLVTPIEYHQDHFAPDALDDACFPSSATTTVTSEEQRVGRSRPT